MNIANQFAQTATKLADPTSATLFLREVLYRGCEAQLNNDSAAVTGLFTTTIEAYKDIVTADERSSRLKAIAGVAALLPDAKQKDSKLIGLEGAAFSDPAKLADLYEYAATLLPAAPAPAPTAVKKKAPPADSTGAQPEAAPAESTSAGAPPPAKPASSTKPAAKPKQP